MSAMVPYQGLNSRIARTTGNPTRLATGPQADRSIDDAPGLSIPRNPGAAQKGYVDRLA